MKKYYLLKRIVFFSILIIGLAQTSCNKKNITINELMLELQDGDIIFQTSLSAQSKAIQLATHSKYSHMGMIYKKDQAIYVFEAVQPVKLTPLEVWIKRGKNEHFVVKRLKESDKVLSPEVKLKIKELGKQFLGKDYDIYFEWTNNRIYCSELVWKIYKQAANIEIGKLETLEDFDLSNEVVKKILVERYGDKIPNNEIVISPESMFNSEKLITIFEN